MGSWFVLAQPRTNAWCESNPNHIFHQMWCWVSWLLNAERVGLENDMSFSSSPWALLGIGCGSYGWFYDWHPQPHWSGSIVGGSPPSCRIVSLPLPSLGRGSSVVIAAGSLEWHLQPRWSGSTVVIMFLPLPISSDLPRCWWVCQHRVSSHSLTHLTIACLLTRRNCPRFTAATLCDLCMWESN